MLEQCRRDQWSVSDLDWSGSPRSMSREDEEQIVQLFTDMAGIERLASAMFREQERRVEDPRLKAIFATFIRDEIRHAQTAQMLADFYDVHHFRHYQESESLRAFSSVFVEAIHHLSDDVANAYIVTGELLLDIALLRSIDDHVGDAMSGAAMRLINRDESRHIAIDYYMSAYYASDEYEEKQKLKPKLGLKERAQAASTFSRMLYRAQPFIRDVFLRPMEKLDPRGKRLRAAFKRSQLLGMKEKSARRPFTRFTRSLQAGFENPVLRPVLGDVFVRLSGVGPDFLARLYTDEELTRARGMSYEALADEALEAKQEN
ncbi:uncharacterized protein CMC5_010850 [Chondromyces crocatus]|uniref:Ferritin-like domain-containing protein n=2 Tax=Chondromyces crocatus TaxID=52 RepID=A0A0K1E7X5_CHOCO|nr:uncharacterized protein CMC5_010850 [Chondromyces crocatus]